MSLTCDNVVNIIMFLLCNGRRYNILFKTLLTQFNSAVGAVIAVVQLVLLGNMFLQLVLLTFFSFIQLGKPAEANDGEYICAKI